MITRNWSSIIKRIVICQFLLLNISFSVTRVAYTRPGYMMKIPASSITRSPYLFSTGFGMEIHSFSPFNPAKGVYFSMDVSENVTFAFSSGQGADTTALENIAESTYIPPVEFGFHLQRRMYVYGDISFSLGVHDIVFENDPDGLSLDPKQLSFFGAVGSQKQLGEYQLSTYMGFGTGGFGKQVSEATQTETDTIETGTSAGVFAGFLLKMPYMEKWGGLDIVGEFDGSGINVGIRIPLTSDYRLSLGFTHIENLPDFSGTTYNPAHPGLTVGLDMSVMRGLRGMLPQLPGGVGAGPSPPVPSAGLVDSILWVADIAMTHLRDSLRVARYDMRNLSTHVSGLKQKTSMLEDSVKVLRLEKNVTSKNINRAMRHLSRSLRYFYAGDYREALQEVETSMELNPNLALAYARRGSIYYKLGDVQRATINWNLALQLDPEYDDVRNILKALHENRLMTTSFKGGK